MKSLAGQLLIASPRLADPNFRRSVVFIVQHNEDGALGLILNRPLETTIQEAWRQVSDKLCSIEGPIFQGGPCDGPLMVLHGQKQHGMLQVIPGIFFTTEKKSVERLVSHGRGAMKFFVGYAGWSQNQLEAEMDEGGWFAAPANRQRVFESEDIWQPLLKAATGPAAVFKLDPKYIPEDPSLN